MWQRGKSGLEEVKNSDFALDRGNPLKTLREKWFEVPAGDNRLRTTDLINMSDHELLSTWKNIRDSATSGSSFDIRGWYHALYLDSFTKNKVMDVGSGLGIDGITFAQNGTKVTFVDIVQSNLELLKRLCSLLGLSNVEFFYLDDFEKLNLLPNNFDVIWCQGSMINLPYEIAREESSLLLKHLAIGGRWIELAYPKERWIREGGMPLNIWGEKTDGGAPWIEWYDLEKMCNRLDSATFKVILSFNFHNNDFNWFDLVRVK